MLATQTIPTIDPSAVETFRREYLNKRQPVVIEGGLAHWPAFTSWTDEYLLHYSGHAEVVIKSKSDYADGMSIRETEEQGVVALRDAIRYMSTDDPSEMSYVRETDILKKLPRLRRDVIDPPHIPEGTLSKGPLLWIGPSWTRAQMHWDPWNNIFGQIRGRKKFILLPHSQIELAYPVQFDIRHAESFESIRQTRPSVLEKLRGAVSSLERRGVAATPVNFKQELLRHLDGEDVACLLEYLHDINNCHVDAEYPDFETHPEFRDAEPVEFVLEAGDLLFIPFCHLHYVRSMEPSISINWFFEQTPEENHRFEDSVRIVAAHLIP